MHGGKQARGLAHHATKTGILSKDMPTRMIADYEAARNDPDLVALRDEMALVQAREADLLRRVDTGEAGASWKAAQAAMAEFRRAQRADDAPAAATALRTLDTTLADGAADYAAWDELLRVIETRRRLAETERRRLEAIQEHITGERAALVAVALVNAVRRNVTDRRTLAAIELDFQLVIGRRPDAGGDQPGVAP